MTLHLPSTPPAQLALAGPIGRLYQFPQSSFCYKVRLAAAYKGIALELRWATVGDLQRLQKRTGLGKVPCIEVDGELVTDSTQILSWLDRRAPESPLYPADARDRAECALLEDWADEALNLAVEPITWMERDGPLLDWIFEGRPFGDRMIRPLMRVILRRKMAPRVTRNGGPGPTRALIGAQVALIEARLAGRTWLYGEQPTAADFAIAAQLLNPWRLRMPEVEGSPGVQRMLDTCGLGLGLSRT